MTAATITNTAALFRQIWKPGVDVSLYPTAGAAWALCPKETDWKGDTFYVVLDVGGSNGISSTFSAAKNRQKPSVPVRFAVTTSDRFGFWSVDNKALTLCQGEGAQIDLLQHEAKKVLMRLMLAQASMIHGNIGGSIGRISAISGSTFTLDNIDNIKNLEEGDALYLSSADGSSSGDALRAGGPLTVVSLDIDTGIVTCDAGIVATIGAAAVNDYVFRDGDFALAPAGFEAWNPLTITSTSFFGLDRSTGAKWRKAGIRKDVSATVGYQNKIKEALIYAHRANAKFTHMFVDPTFFGGLEQELQTSVRYVDEYAKGGDGKETTIGFRGINFTQHGYQPVKIFPDAFGPLNVARGVNFDNFSWKSAGKFPDLLTQAGEKLITLESSNAVEGRIGGYGQFVCGRPSDMGRFKLA